MPETMGKALLRRRDLLNGKYQVVLSVSSELAGLVSSLRQGPPMFVVESTSGRADGRGVIVAGER